MQNDRNIYLIDSGESEFERDSLRQLLQAMGVGFNPVRPAGGELSGLRDRAPGCVLMDVDAAGADAGAVFDALVSRRASLPIVVVSRQSDPAAIIEAMRLGACDFLMRPVVRVTLDACLARVFERIGSEVVAFARQREARLKIQALTDRERDILHGLMSGWPNKVIAHQLGISVRTIEMHRSHLMAKLGVQNLAQAIYMTFDSGIVLELRVAECAVSKAAASGGGAKQACY